MIALRTYDAAAQVAESRSRCADRGFTERLVVGADDLEVLVDEDVVGPVDADVVDLVIAVAQLHDTVHDAARVGRQRRFCGLIRRGSAGERPDPWV
jgi:hypothetical protein